MIVDEPAPHPKADFAASTERSRGSPQTKLRRQNERAIFRAIRDRGVVSRTQLAEITGLSAQSVGRVARRLVADQLVEETEIQRGNGPGAPPVGLRMRADGAVALGFGLERDSLTGVALDLGGNVRWQVSRTLPRGEQAEATVRRIQRDVLSLFEMPEWAERRERVCGLGLAAPGPIDRTTGTIVGPPNFPSWDHVDAAEMLGQRLNLPVVVDNAANAAAIGAKWRMPRSHGSFLYCYWGLGIGGGLVLGDEVYRGSTGNAIEIGHTSIAWNGRPCQCGNVGCLEVEASATALLRDAAEYGTFSTVEDLLAASSTSAPIAALVVDAGEKMAAAIINAVNVLDVNEVVIGGDHFREVQEVFLPIIRARLETRAFRRQVAATKVTTSGIGEIASALGAATLVFHALLPGSGR
jgi:predicted NBD/HSP70 family sugar kinase